MVTNVNSERKAEATTKLHVFDCGKATEADTPPHRLARNARLQLVLPEQSVDRLEGLKEATEATSYAEVIRRALRIYEGLLAEAEAGGVLFVRRSDGSQEVVPLKVAL